MARLITRLADLCRQRAHDELFLRRFRMMRPGDDDDAGGPGWYDSSRELRLGLLVEERDDEHLIAEWHAAQQRPGPALRAAASGA
ncbi:hypothetical protein FSC37_06970 [Piscinibacter aquaticus]|uniref:Uncharacterized protein n=1 Tax=Piscinibacter aquaticus TaxID=392597 RepID=A0A5C6U253_9BURK|nr:hypothetical protein FSC37_06970 [Piscinibacter aquaticus]